MKRTLGGLSLLVIVAGVVGACVGDDPNPTTPERQPDPNITVGHEGGACTADKKCIAGLVCIRDVICLPPEDGGSPSTDGGGGSTDATPDVDSGDSSASSGCGYTATASNQEVTCEPAVCPGNAASKCCLQASGAPACSTCSTGTKISCDSKDECNSNACCLELNSPLATGGNCPVVVDYTQLKDTGCGLCSSTNQYVVCRSDTDCAGLAGTKCGQVRIGNADFQKIIGVCL